MNNCVHQWIYIGSKRQDVWRCIFCDEYKINDATQKREWQGLTDEERSAIVQNFSLNVGDWTENGDSVARAIEAKLKEKNT